MLTDKTLLLLAVLAPTAMSLIGIISTKSDLRDLRKEFRCQFSGISGQLDDFRSHFSEVRRQQEAMSKKMDDMMVAGHKDALEIMRLVTTLHERLVVVEAKQE